MRVFIRQVQSGPQTISSAGRRAAAGDLKGHLAVLDAAGETLARAGGLPRRYRRRARSASSRRQLGHLAAQDRGGALGEDLALGSSAGLRIASLWAASRSSSGITFGGVGRRLAVEPHVADPVLVVDRPERGKKLREHCDWPTATSPLPFPRHDVMSCSFESTNLVIAEYLSGTSEGTEELADANESLQSIRASEVLLAILPVSELCGGVEHRVC